MSVLRVGIVGAGKIGAKRAREVARAHDSRLVAVVDSDAVRARALAGEYACRSGTDWEALVSSREVDAVIVATTHRWLARVSLGALDSHKHVLCEKPLARNAAEARPVVAASTRNGARLMTGFNHREPGVVGVEASRATAGELVVEAAAGLKRAGASDTILATLVRFILERSS